MKRYLAPLLFLMSLAGLSACTRGPSTAEPSPPEGWSVTTWGGSFEIFSEVDPLVAGESAHANTHVTELDRFTPVRAGLVAAILKGPDGTATVFEQREPRRDGIFVVEIKPRSPGLYDLAFRVKTDRLDEEIPAGRVRVGSAASPGGLEEPPPPPHGSPPALKDETQATSFLKEQQWRTEFSTDWIKEGLLRSSVSGPARVLPPAGAEVHLTAPVDAVVAPNPWPHRGLELSEGRTVFRLVPKVAIERSLPGMRADVSALQAEAGLLRNRHERLVGLLKLEAISEVEVERALAARQTIEARLEAGLQDLAAATAARSGRDDDSAFSLAAPWAGQVAEVHVSPGQSVAAGDPLARFVKIRPLWLDVALPPEQAARIRGTLGGAFIRRPGDNEPAWIPPEDVRLVSLSPEIDPRTATQGVLLEVDRRVTDLPLGIALDVEIVLAGNTPATLIPAGALVDDAGVTVVYEQLEGESFARREVRILARQGAAVSVDGLRPGVRVVTRGGSAIRRASLLSAGAPEGHVH